MDAPLECVLCGGMVGYDDAVLADKQRAQDGREPLRADGPAHKVCALLAQTFGFHLLLQHNQYCSCSICTLGMAAIRQAAANQTVVVATLTIRASSVVAALQKHTSRSGGIPQHAAVHPEVFRALRHEMAKDERPYLGPAPADSLMFQIPGGVVPVGIDILLPPGILAMSNWGCHTALYWVAVEACPADIILHYGSKSVPIPSSVPASPG